MKKDHEFTLIKTEVKSIPSSIFGVSQEKQPNNVNNGNIINNNISNIYWTMYIGANHSIGIISSICFYLNDEETQRP